MPTELEKRLFGRENLSKLVEEVRDLTVKLEKMSEELRWAVVRGYSGHWEDAWKTLASVVTTTNKIKNLMGKIMYIVKR